VKGLLVRVGADQSGGGGQWNAPMDSSSGRFLYVAIPESSFSHPALVKPYAEIAGALDDFGCPLPGTLSARNMHLDPDFEHLTYGDQGERAKQLLAKVGAGDLLVFYAGLRDVRSRSLVYAIIGVFVVDDIVRAADVPEQRWHENAHTRRVLARDANDVIVRGRPHVSGRLERCIPIGDFRDRAYRVRPELQEEWGGLGVRDGYLQRSARLPEFLDAERFHRWLLAQRVPLMQGNN
jgi:hypothetical protein